MEVYYWTGTTKRQTRLARLLMRLAKWVDGVKTLPPCCSHVSDAHYIDGDGWRVCMLCNCVKPRYWVRS